VEYAIYTLALPFDLWCESVTYIYIYTSSLKTCAYVAVKFNAVASNSDFTSHGKKISTTSMRSSTSEGNSFIVKEMSEATLGTVDCQDTGYTG